MIIMAEFVFSPPDSYKAPPASLMPQKNSCPTMSDLENELQALEACIEAVKQKKEEARRAAEEEVKKAAEAARKAVEEEARKSAEAQRWVQEEKRQHTAAAAAANVRKNADSGPSGTQTGSSAGVKQRKNG